MAAAGSRLLALLPLLAGCTSIAADQRTFESTRWRVTAINGQATPPVDAYSMIFHANGGLAARFGCNLIGGTYRVADDTLAVTGATMTLMGCPEPAATFESEGSAILAKPMRLRWRSARQLTLRNGAGSIEVELLH